MAEALLGRAEMVVGLEMADTSGVASGGGRERASATTLLLP